MCAAAATTPPAPAALLPLPAASSPAPPALELERLRAATAEHIRRAKAEATLRAYRSDVRDFTKWAVAHQLAPLPAEPDTVALYLSACAERKLTLATIRRRLFAIAHLHRTARLPSPTGHETVRHTLAGLARQLGARPRQVAPLRLAQLRAMLAATPEDRLLEVRDRAILLLGFASGMRRSELGGLDVGDLRFVAEGVDVLVRRSKTDQEGAGRVIGVPRGRRQDTCPVVALQRWLRLAGLAEDPASPLFRRIVPPGRPRLPRPGERPPAPDPGRVARERLSPRGVARAVQQAAVRAGLDPGLFAGHSLRSGFATEAAAQGAPERAIMRQTGHRSLETLRRYIRDGERYRENAASYLGL